MSHSFLKVHIPKNRIYGLDLLRAFAILTVVYAHGTHYLYGLLPEAVLEFFVLDGVAYFFVLSGFLIGRILIKNIEDGPFGFAQLHTFWKRRWWRTLPNYFLVLSVLFVLYRIVGWVSWKEVPEYLLFIQNFSKPHPSFFAEAWSLAVEEWFYLLIPLCIYLVMKTGVLPRRAFLFVVLFFCVLSTGVRYSSFLHHSIDTPELWDQLIRKQVITRFDSIVFGVLGAYVSFYMAHWWKRWPKRLFVVGVILLLADFTYCKYAGVGLYTTVFSFTVVSIGTLFLLPFLSTYQVQEGFVSRVVTRISLISYSMYLINLSLVQSGILAISKGLSLSKISPYDGVVSLGLYLVFTGVGSILLYNYFEVPTTAFRDKV